MNKLINYIILSIILLCGFYNVGNAQDPLNSIEVKEQLLSKGITESQLNSFLDTRNLTIADLETMQPEQLLQLNNDLEAYLSSTPSEPANEAANESTNIQSSQDQTNEASKVKESIDSQSTPPVEEVPEKKNKVERYGDQLFNNNNFSLIEIGSKRPVPGNYILNTGDQVTVSIYGRSQLDKLYTINNDGAILYDNGNRRMILAGLSLNQAREKIARVFRNYYVFNPGEISVNVSGVSTINVNIYGEVRKPGGYLISAVNSPVNAIFAADGILSTGSYRKILLFKDDGSSQNIDIYKLLNSPESYTNLTLSNNDIIQVANIGKEVILQGEVRRPLRYELTENESIGDLLKFAGGFTFEADRSRLQIIRFENSKRRIIDVEISDSSLKNFELKNGDLVKILNVSGDINNQISASGQINNEGTFELEQDMRVSDLLDQLILNEKSRLDLALIERTFPDGKKELIQVNLSAVDENKSDSQNIILQPNDKLLIWSKSRFTDTASSVSISGAVKNPGSYSIDIINNSSLSDLILYAGGLRRDASDLGMIYRTDPLNKKNIKYIKINPKSIETDQSKDVILMPFDSIVILGNARIIDSYNVSISGLVIEPGTYQYGEDMTVKDLIILAKGFKLGAKTNQIEVNRLVIEENESTEVKVATLESDFNLLEKDEASSYKLQPFDRVYVRAVPDFETQQVVSLSGEVKYPGKYVLQNKNESLSSLINRAGGLTSQAFVDGATLFRNEKNLGYIIMDLNQAMKNKNSKFNYALKPQDQIIIPKNEDVVTLKSSTLNKRIPISENDFNIENQISFAYFPGKSAKYYIQEFGGGFAENSNKRGVFVQHANGEIIRTKDFGLFKVYPKVRKGSTIVIPVKKVETDEEGEKEDVNWNKLLSDSVAQAMSILTLLLLAERI